MHGFRVIDLLGDASLANLARIVGALPEYPALSYDTGRPRLRTPSTDAEWLAFDGLDRLMRERASVLPRAR